jgi:hypothetical protein
MEDGEWRMAKENLCAIFHPPFSILVFCLRGEGD